MDYNNRRHEAAIDGMVSLEIGVTGGTTHIRDPRTGVRRVGREGHVGRTGEEGVALGEGCLDSGGRWRRERVGWTWEAGDVALRGCVGSCGACCVCPPHLVRIGASPCVPLSNRTGTISFSGLNRENELPRHVIVS